MNATFFLYSKLFLPGFEPGPPYPAPAVETVKARRSSDSYDRQKDDHKMLNFEHQTINT